MRAAYTLPPLPSLSLLSDGGGGCYGTCRGGRLLWRRGRDIGGWRRGEATLSLEGANAPPKKCENSDHAQIFTIFAPPDSTLWTHDTRQAHPPPICSSFATGVASTSVLAGHQSTLQNLEIERDRRNAEADGVIIWDGRSNSCIIDLN